MWQACRSHGVMTLVDDKCNYPHVHFELIYSHATWAGLMLNTLLFFVLFCCFCTPSLPWLCSLPPSHVVLCLQLGDRGAPLRDPCMCSRPGPPPCDAVKSAVVKTECFRSCLSKLSRPRLKLWKMVGKRELAIKVNMIWNTNRLMEYIIRCSIVIIVSKETRVL